MYVVDSFPRSMKDVGEESEMLILILNGRDILLNWI